MLPAEAILAVTTSLFAIISIVLVYKLTREKQKTSYINKNQDKSYQYLNDAMKKAQDILGKAAMEQVNAVGYTKVQSDKLEHAAEASLQLTAKHADEAIQKEVAELHQQLQTFKAQVDKSQQEYLNYLKSLQLGTGDTQKLAQDLMNRAIQDQTLQIKTQLNTFIEKLEGDLSSFLHKTEEQSVHSLELELKAARQMVETYKQQQFVLIDENIIAILERTLSLVLAKKLTLHDHVDLVYESLEKAKLEKFIV
jgi:uncharacterized protein involved in tolerance to divalent cations